MEEIKIVTPEEHEIETYSGYICGWGCSNNESGVVCIG